MTHLAAGARAALSIEMQADPRLRQRRLEWRRSMLPQLTEQIADGAGPENSRVAERQIADRSHDLLELTRRARDLRLVIRVVGARRKLVDEQRSVREQEYLDRENPLERERFRDAARDLVRLCRHAAGQGRGN